MACRAAVDALLTDHMGLPRIALLAQLATTLPLVGLIWFVQIVAYPLFARVAAGEFQAYHQAHSRLITYVVGPLMLGELVSALVWLVRPVDGVPRQIAWIGAALAIATWGLTMFVAVPKHNVLAGGFAPRTHELLVATNWLRTAVWTARGAILLWVVAVTRGPQV